MKFDYFGQRKIESELEPNNSAIIGDYPVISVDLSAQISSKQEQSLIIAPSLRFKS